MSNKTENLVMYSTGIVLALAVLIILANILDVQEYRGLLLFFNVTMCGSILVFSINIYNEVRSRA